MCDVCGCGDAGVKTRPVSVRVGASLLAANDRAAAHLREHFAADGVFAVNVMGSPGSGKTALLEALAAALLGRWRLAAVSGDLATALDADRLARAGVAAAAITTGSACHLDAAMVHAALHDSPIGAAARGADVFFIENVGNLVCPAVYDLGQAVNVVVLSVTEGTDKPLKYPLMFLKADLVVFSKVDLLPHLAGVTLDALRENLSRVAPAAPSVALSAVTGEGVGAFVAWLEARRARASSATPPASP